MLLGISDLLERHGFDPTIQAKLVRHQDARYDVEAIRREGWFDLYQSFQSRPVFDKCSQIVAFVGAGKTRARFVGVYKVNGTRDPRSVQLPEGFPYPQWRANAVHSYDLEPAGICEALTDRVVIDWGGGTRAWVQGLRNKEIVELIPEGRVQEPFIDYQEFTLSHAELKQLVHSPDANQEWRARLSAVAGIYLITALPSGMQYVGSASGPQGIWGRWQSYAANGHGGNRLLREIVKKDPRYPREFQYTVLHVLPAGTTNKEVLRWESIYKQKLGTRAIGLNLN